MFNTSNKAFLIWLAANGSFTYAKPKFYLELLVKSKRVGEAQAVGEFISTELNKASDGYDRSLFYREWNQVKRAMEHAA